MKSFIGTVGGIALTAKAVSATPMLFNEPSTNVAKRAATSCNTASNRSCWTTDGYTIDTNYVVDYPTTGVTRQYTLYVTEVENANLDGTVKNISMLINGTYPGEYFFSLLLLICPLLTCSLQALRSTLTGVMTLKSPSSTT